MKITDPDVIRNGENDLIKAVTDDLDLNAVKEIIKQRLAAADLSSRGGQIVVHNNEIAFRLDFDLQLSGSLMFDRQGNYIPESYETCEHENIEHKNLIPENLDTIDINDSLNEESNKKSDDELDDEPLEDFNIDIPDDDLEKNFFTKDERSDTSKDSKNIRENEDSTVAISTPDQFNNDSEPEPGMENEEFIPDDLIDDDINDILKESQDFWELKKEE
ncbi:hypothetical protein [Desulfobacula phenolica]|uniref:Uncharacterized protein n=1 Tax=Desulfobacula phenolica TaxID=90732 RepID=A0A1H2HF49_9BACT|nr:hypothetical protein [Desulfobacula phenolica]SDU30453.1 hypothetical protein SAMN04487931_106209 [Desulfobacula phenolica]